MANTALPAAVCCVLFAVCYTRQILCRVHMSLCRVPKAHGKQGDSGSDGTLLDIHSKIFKYQKNKK